jgi:hypothetical protein
MPKKKTLASLARAGSPVGVLLGRILRQLLGRPAHHYSLSIIRERGLDENALRFLLERYPPAAVVFVHGWTGKGAIAAELEQAVSSYNSRQGVALDPGLYAVADLCGAAAWAAGADDAAWSTRRWGSDGWRTAAARLAWLWMKRAGKRCEVAQAIAVSRVGHLGSNRLHQSVASDGNSNPGLFSLAVEFRVIAQKVGLGSQMRYRQPQQSGPKIVDCFCQALERRVGAEVDRIPAGVEQNHLGQKRG